ncbi:MAG: hypothetical protein EXS05_15375 [Planctomycetaceae bacterium]|nr:hypothetical protein [Planctomycetaceae bacterium]
MLDGIAASFSNGKDGELRALRQAARKESPGKTLSGRGFRNFLDETFSLRDESESRPRPAKSENPARDTCFST